MFKENGIDGIKLISLFPNFGTNADNTLNVFIFHQFRHRFVKLIGCLPGLQNIRKNQRLR